MKKISAFQLITVLATLITIMVNVLANTLPLNGQGTGEISDRFAIYFVPAGYVFSIWLLIYIGLIVFTVFQANPTQKNNQLIRSISPAYWVASIANSTWIFLWHYEIFPLTVICMFVILAGLLVVYIKLSGMSELLSTQQKTLVMLPFSIYLGWISVATIANVSQYLYLIGWDGWEISPPIWAVIMLVVAMSIGLLMLLKEKNAAFSLVLIWAFIGIAINQSYIPDVATTAWGASLILALLTVIVLIANRKRINAS